MAKNKEDSEKAQENLDDLVRRCLVFIDRNGKVLDRGSHPFSAWLKMKYTDADLNMSFRVQNSPMSNGSSYVKVKYKGETVLEAEGSFHANPYGNKAKVYLPGEWEKRFPKIK